MKKILILIVSLLLCLNGCSKTQVVKNDINNKDEINVELKDKKENRSDQLTEEYYCLNDNKELPKKFYTLGIDGTNVIIKDSADDMALKSKVYKYNILDNSIQEIGELINYNMMSNDTGYINGHIIYSADLFTFDPKESHKIIDINYKDKNITYQQTLRTSPPFSFWGEMSKDKLMVLVPESTDIKNTYNIYSYNVNTSKLNVVKTYEYDANNSGTIVYDITCKNGMIYLPCTEYKNGLETQALKMIDENGKEINQVSLDDLTEKAKSLGETVYTMEMFGNVIIFKTLSGTPLYYIIDENNQILPLEFPAKQINFVTQNTKNNSTAFLFDYVERVLYKLNGKDGSYKTLDLKDKTSDFEDFSFVGSDSDGNCIVYASKSLNEVGKHYYVPSKTLDKYFK